MNKIQNKHLRNPNDLFKGVRLNKANLGECIATELPECPEKQRVVGVYKNLEKDALTYGFAAIATQNHFYIYDSEMKLKYIFSGYRNGSIRQAD